MKTYNLLNGFMGLKTLLVMGLVMVTGILAGFEVGDYQTKGIWGYFDDVNNWSTWNGTTWQDAATPPPSPFDKTIYMNHFLYLNDNLTLASGARMTMATGTSLVYCDCGPTVKVESGATVDLTSILLSKNGTLENHGVIQAQDGITASIQLESGDHDTGRAFLHNYGSIIMSGNNKTDNSFTVGGHAQMISGKDAYVSLEGSLSVAAYAEAELFIANPGGFLGDLASSAAIRHSGATPLMGHIYFTFDGDSPQETNIPDGLVVASVVIDNPTTVTLNSNIKVYSWLLQDGDPGGWVRVKSGSTLDVLNNVIMATDTWNGNAEFILESGATIITRNPDGISSEAVDDRIIKGSIQMNIASYSSGANYTYNGTGVQHTGCFDTTPLAHTVHDLTADDSNGLTELIFCEQGINITGTPTGTEYFSGNYTLPVTLANLLLQQTPQGFPQLNWLTASETNCMGFYVWRAQDLDLGAAMRVSTLIEAVNTSQGAAYAWTDAELDEDGTYYYWLEDISFNQETAFHGPRMITVSFGSGHSAPEITQSTGLKKAYPNPFNPNVWLSFYVAETSVQVKLDFYNQRGQRVDSIQLSNQPKGSHTLRWNTEGLNLPSGIYYVRFTSESSSNTIKVVLSK